MDIYWRGPFKISQNFFYVIFEVNCGRFDSMEPIHLDRIRKAADQTLQGEEIEQYIPVPETEEFVETQDEFEEQEGCPDPVGRKAGPLTVFINDISDSSYMRHHPVHAILWQRYGIVPYPRFSPVFSRDILFPG